MDEVETATTALERLGLTEYEARCFVALTRLPHGTAKEIGQVANIPRSRVYETMDSLGDRGLIEVEEGDPRTFQSVSLDAALRTLRKEYDEYFETVERTLRSMEPMYKETQQSVWAIEDHEQVTQRVIDLVDGASDELLVIPFEESLLGPDLLDALAVADRRGVAVYVGTTDEKVRERIHAADLDATVFETDLVEWFGAMDDTPRIGRIVMADRQPVLASALHDERLPGVPNETAAWTDGIDHGFATFAERVLSYELEMKILPQSEK